MGTVICITGPMAAGKNELSLILEEFGWLHIDADMLAHFAIDNCKEDILKTFLPYAKKKNINLLKKDGSIALKTDNDSLFEFSLEEFAANGFTLDEVSYDLHSSDFAKENVMTEYEANFSKQGIPIKRCVAKL